VKLLDSVLRYHLPNFGLGVRWLTEEIHAAGVTVPLTRAYLNELVADAEHAALNETAGSEPAEPHLDRLRRELVLRAAFVRAWTLSDEPIDDHTDLNSEWVKQARRHSLPRLWRLSEPVAAAARHPTPTYLNWTSAS
jgi:hypothetical protein